MKLEFLENLVTIISGYAFKSALFNEVGEGLPIVRVRDINSKFAGTYYSGEFNDMFIINNGDLLIGLDGDFKCIEWKNGKALLNQRVCKIIPKSNLISQAYLLYFLPSVLNEIHRNTNFTTVKHLSVQKIKKIKIPLPDKLIDQIRIAEVLTKAENLIQHRRESIDLLDNFLNSTFLEMFGDPVRNEKKWNIKTIDKLVKKEKNSIRRGPFGGALKKEIFVSDGFLVYEQYHALNNNFNFSRYFIDEEKFKELKSFEVHPGDIIISCSGIYLGKLAVIPQNAKKGIINQALLKLSLDRSLVSTNFFLYVFRHNSFRSKFFGNIRGSGVPNFPPVSDFKKFEFIDPPLVQQNKFAFIVEKAEEIKKQYIASLQELENLFGSLSHRAFKGELNLSTLNVTEKIREIEKKIDNEQAFALSKESKITNSMQHFIKQTEQLGKIMKNVSDAVPNSFLKQINTLNKSIETFQKLPTIPDQLLRSIKSFEAIRSISTQLDQKQKEQPTYDKGKLTWDEVNFEMVAKWIKEEFANYHFNSELLFNFLVNDRVAFPNYHSSEELKIYPKLVESDDLKSFVFSALNNENQFIKLEQFFYDAEKENVQLKLRQEDYQFVNHKEKGQHSGIYFKIIE